CEPETDPRLGLRGEERLEDAPDVLRADADPAVYDGEASAVLRGLRRDDDHVLSIGARKRSVAGVEHEVLDHRVKLRLVHTDAREGRVQARLEPDALLAELVIELARKRADDRVHVDR